MKQWNSTFLAIFAELNRYFIAAPKHGSKNAEIPVYEVQ